MISILSPDIMWKLMEYYAEKSKQITSGVLTINKIVHKTNENCVILRVVSSYYAWNQWMP